MPKLLLVLLVLSACAAPADRDDFDYDLEDDTVDRQELPAGLDEEQAASLTSLGIPVVVPSEPGAFTIVDLEASSIDGAAFYAVSYRRADGVCFNVSGGNDGFGGPAFPIVSTDIDVRGLGRTVRLYEASRDPGATSAMDWGPGTVVSDYIELDTAAALFQSNDMNGCQPVSLEEGTRIVRSLIRLEPTSRASRSGTGLGALGSFAPADDLLEGANAASSPDLAADAIARRYNGEADRVTVGILSESSYEATALVTALGLYDDSIRDERLRLTYTPYNGTWELTAAGRQVRCQQGRGHQDWSDQACL